MGQYRRGTSAYAAALLGTFLIVGGTLLGVGAADLALSEGDLPTGASGLEGSVVSDNGAEIPTAGPAVYGYIKVSGAKRTNMRKRVTTAYEAPVGSPEVVLRTGDDRRTLHLPPFSPDAWLWCAAARTNEDNPGDSDLSRLVGDEINAYDKVMVDVWSIHQGDPLLVELADGGQVRRLWCGTRAQVVDRQRSLNEFGTKALGSTGALFALLGLLAFGLQFLLLRSESRRPPAAGSQAGHWILWALSQRSAHWRGVWGGRTAVGQRLTRKFAEGVVIIRLSAATATRLTLMRRRGSPVHVGRAIDHMVGAEVSSGEALGYSGCELAATDRTWGRAFVGRTSVQTAIEDLFTADAGSALVSVSIRPGFISLTMPYVDTDQVTLEVIDTWLRSLKTLAEQAEGDPQPADKVTPSWMETMALEPARVQRFGLLVVLALTVITLLLSALLVATMA